MLTIQEKAQLREIIGKIVIVRPNQPTFGMQSLSQTLATVATLTNDEVRVLLAKDTANKAIEEQVKVLNAQKMPLTVTI